MQKLKIILQFKYLYILLSLIALTFSIIITTIPKYKSEYNKDETDFICIIEDYKIDGNKLEFNLNCKEKLIATYYIKTKEEKEYYENNLNIGSTLKIEGTLNIPEKNTIPYLFNYKKYLYNKKIYYTLSITNFTEIKKTKNIFYKLKNIAFKKSQNNSYIYAYILGKTYKINNDVIESYRTNGISHLFALSGLHVGIFSMILLTILSKLKINKLLSYIISFLFLLIFSFISGFSPSILRASLLFFLLGINKILKLEIKTINILLLVFTILVLINPFIIYNISFIMSFTTTFFIILGNNLINDKNYLKGLLKVSTLSFISNIALSIYYFNYINPLGILLNIIFVPLVSFVIFPLTILTYCFSFLTEILNILTNLMENMSLYLSKYMIKIYFPHISFLEVLIFYIILLLTLRFKNKSNLILLLCIIGFWKIKPFLINDTRIFYIDVGQGNSLLLITPHTNKTIMIDTGGIIKWDNESWKKTNKSSSIAKNQLIPLLRNLGVNKLDYLILSHGDYDHMGEASNLVNNFKIEKVIFNCGEYNNLEKELINLLEEKKIEYHTCMKEINIEKYKLQFLNTKVYNNENDNSSVIYLNYNNHKFLFMADAGIEKEKDILDKYNLINIDYLQVGHHGSNTSSSKEFINSINPKYSLISVGKNNRYGHPNKETLKNLKNSKIYRTDKNGSIVFNINKNKLKIKTYQP